MTLYPRVVNGKVITRPTYDSYHDPYLSNYFAKKMNPEPPGTPPVICFDISINSVLMNHNLELNPRQ